MLTLQTWMRWQRSLHKSSWKLERKSLVQCALVQIRPKHGGLGKSEGQLMLESRSIRSIHSTELRPPGGNMWRPGDQHIASFAARRRKAGISSWVKSSARDLHAPRRSYGTSS